MLRRRLPTPTPRLGGCSTARQGDQGAARGWVPAGPVPYKAHLKRGATAASYILTHGARESLSRRRGLFYALIARALWRCWCSGDLSM